LGDAKILLVERGLAKTLMPTHRTTAAAWIAGMAQLPRDDWNLLGIAAAGRGGLNTRAKGMEFMNANFTNWDANSGA